MAVQEPDIAKLPVAPASYWMIRDAESWSSAAAGEQQISLLALMYWTQIFNPTKVAAEFVIEKNSVPSNSPELFLAASQLQKVVERSTSITENYFLQQGFTIFFGV